MSLRLESTVGARGQTVIPKPIRDRFKLQPGQKVWFRVENDQIIIEQADPMAILDGFLNAFPKIDIPFDVDWDALYESQYEEKYKGLLPKMDRR